MTTPRVHPRVAKRRREVAREAGRRRLRVVLVFVAALGVIGAAVGLALSPALDVDRVEVRGAGHTSLAAILEATGLDERGHAMVAVDRFALARRVERLPWIASATVTRRWPNVVRVTVREREAIGVIGVPGGVALLDSTGRVLATASAPPAGTFAVVVAPEDEIPPPGHTVAAPVRGALRILTAMSEGLATRVEAARRLPGDPATYELRVRGDVTVRLGALERIGDKLAAAEAVLVHEHPPGSVIDVRVPRAPAVTRAEATTTTTSKS